MESDQRETLTTAAKSWKRRRATLTSERDPLVLAMLRSGQFTKDEIHMLTGLGRMTIDRIEAAAR